MKKIYEAPELLLHTLRAADLLSTSGDATEADGFDAPYGETFS